MTTRRCCRRCSGRCTWRPSSPYRARADVFRLLRRATRWHADNDERMLGYLTGDEAAYRPRPAAGRDEHWALKVLGYNVHAEPTRSDILTAFRRLIRDAHPDHGGSSDGAGQRITDLTEAKRILLAEV